MFWSCIWIILCSLCFRGRAMSIIVTNLQVSFSNAFTACNSIDGNLISRLQFEKHLDDIGKKCTNLTGNYWIGDASTLTPFLELQGCYKFENTTAGGQNYIIIDNNVARCQARCPYDAGIAVKEDNCQCVEKSFIIQDSGTSISKTDCNIQKNEEILGGSQDAMSIYARSSVNSNREDDINPFCAFHDCDSSFLETTSKLCSANNTAKTVCSDYNNIIILSNADDWWTAMENCIDGGNGYLLSVLERNRQSVCGSQFQGKVWTKSRQYKSRVDVSDVGIIDMQAPNIVCRTGNLWSGLSDETGDCNGTFARHGYICVTDQYITNSDPLAADSRCIVNLPSSSTAHAHFTEQTSKNADPIIVSQPTTLQPSSSSTSLPLSGESSLPIGTVAGSIGGGAAFLACLVLVILLFAKRHRRRKEEVLKVANKYLDLDVYADSKEEDYDVLNKRKQRMSQLNQEDTYAHGNSMPQDDNTYDTTQHTVKPKSFENEYDLTRNVLNSNVGESVYDSTREALESKNNDENAYDSTTALGCLGEDTYNTCSVNRDTNDPTYDHAENFEAKHD